MADYCAQADLENYLTAADLVQLADLDGDGQADEAVIARACADASRQIDGYISPRYTVPIAGVVPELLATIAVWWAIYLLQLGRQSVTDDVAKRHEADIAFLKLVGKGEASLGDPVNAGEGDRAPGIRIHADRRAFDREKMRGW